MQLEVAVKGSRIMVLYVTGIVSGSCILVSRAQRVPRLLCIALSCCRDPLRSPTSAPPVLPPSSPSHPPIHPLAKEQPHHGIAVYPHA